MDSNLRGFVLTALLAGLSAAVGYLLIFIPNVEAFTSMLFVTGWLLGLKRGLVAAIIAALLYFGFNPQGMYPPLLVAQVIGSLPAPLAGWLSMKNDPAAMPGRLKLAITAFIITVFYDLITNLSYPLVAGFDINGILTTLAAGLIFSIIHISVNILIFILVVPVLLTHVSRFRIIQ